MTDWSRRSFVTLAMVATAHALQFVPLPGIPLSKLGMRGMLGDWFEVSREPSPMSVAALRLVPFTFSLGVTTVVFTLVPRLSRSLGEPGSEARLLRIGLWLSAPVAAVQSSAIVLFLRSQSPEFQLEELNPWLVGSTLTLFAVLFGALPFALQRWGLGRGLAAVVLLYCLLEITAALHAMAFDSLADVGSVPVRDIALLVTLVVATAGAMRRWVGDALVLPGDPRLDRVGRSLSIALIVLLALNSLGLRGLLVRWASLGQFGEQLLTLGVALGGGLLLANRQSARDAQRIAGAQLLALGSFLVFAAAITALLSEGRVAMPWAESVVATILIYMTWRSSRRTGVDADVVAANGAALAMEHPAAGDDAGGAKRDAGGGVLPS